MTRVSLLLLAVLVLCAVSLVTSRHQSRRIFVELERAQAEARGYETEFGQLQLEQSTWGMPARVEKVAREQLRMQLPTPTRTEVVHMPKEGGVSATAERSEGGAARASLARPTAADTCCLAASNGLKEAGVSATAERSEGGVARASLARPTAADTCCLAASNGLKEAAK